MTMDAMVKYLEDKGFGVSRKYIPKEKVYQFAIAKDDGVMTKKFVYPSWLGNNRMAKNTYMEDWLDSIIAEFEVKKREDDRKREMLYITTSSRTYSNWEHKLTNNFSPVDYWKKDCEITAAIAKEFMSEADKIANSSTRDVRESVTELIKNEIENIPTSNFGINEINEIIKKGKELMGTANKTSYNNMFGYNSRFEIKDVIFNDPATIVFWKDGTKTVVKASNEVYDPEKGLAMAIAKKAYGNQGNYFNKIKKWTGVPVPIPTVKDEDFRDFVESALSCLANRFIKSRTKEFLLEDIRTAKKYLNMTIDIYRHIRCSTGIPYEIEIAAKALDDAVYDTKRTKATLVAGMDKAAYILQTLVQN